jgi:Zn-dependent M28 family amino/carboxypeptidase
LINAHFDTIPGSPGASDDGVGVAVMLELLRAITSNSSTPLDYPVVFLFNGAEEWNHQAAHWFITQHPWSPELQYIINLEAIGAGGREMVFQCNSGYLASVYGKSAPYPYASVVAHEMFKHFLYQFASTDWKTLIQYGKHRRMRGLDTAYTTNGYVYHTLHDNTKAVPSK